MFGQISFEDFAFAMYANYYWLSSILLIFHVIFVFIMLLNVLIGMMGDTYHDIKDRSDQEWHLAYSQIIFSVEAEIPREKLQECTYWTVVGNKRYLQVQDVDKAYFSEFIDEPEETKQSVVAQALEQLDLNKDGKLSFAELAEGEKKALETGQVLTFTRTDSPAVAEKKDKSDDERPNLGPQEQLEGRLDPSIMSS